MLNCYEISPLPFIQTIVNAGQFAKLIKSFDHEQQGYINENARNDVIYICIHTWRQIILISSVLRW